MSRGWLAAVALACGLLIPCAAVAAPRIVVVTDEAEPRLLSVDADAPETLRSTRNTGFAPMPHHGLDLRARTQSLAAAFHATTTVFDLVGTGTGFFEYTPAVEFGVREDIGFDVDPTAELERYRIVTPGGENLLVSWSGDVVRGPAIDPPHHQLVGLAATNAFPGATTTSWFAFDTLTDSLVALAPESGAVTTIGPAGIAPDAGTAVGFDIAAGQASGFLSATVGGVTRLYRIDLATGAATVAGTIGDGSVPIRDLTAIENVISLSADSYQVGEGAATVQVEMDRESPRGTLAVDYVLIDDRTVDEEGGPPLLRGRVTFGPGETQRALAVPTRREEARIIAIVLDSPKPSAGVNAILRQRQATFQVPGADPPPVPTPTPAPAPASPAPSPSPSPSGSTARDRAPAATTDPRPPRRPAVRLTRSTVTRAQLRAGVDLRLTCREACAAAAELRSGTRYLGTGRARLARAGTRTLRLTLSAVGRRRLARLRSVVVDVVVTDASNRITLERLTFRLR